MAILGELGIITDIDCFAAPDSVIVKEGELLFPVPAGQLEDWVPANCPRRGQVNMVEELGCVTCGNSILIYEDGTIEC